MKISNCHSSFVRYNLQEESLETPELFLGQNYLALLNFWIYLDTLDPEQWRTVEARYVLLNSDFEYNSYWSKFTYIPDHFWNCAFNLKLDRSGVRLAVELAAYEIYIMDSILNDGNRLIYLPLFDNL